MDSILSIINELESEDLSISHPDNIRIIIKKFHSKPIPVLVTTLPQKSLIFRAREIDDFCEIRNESDLTFRPAYQNTSYARATSPGSTMFYGIHTTIQSHEDAGKAACGSMVEACEFLRKPPTKNENKAVVGVWEVIESLDFFTIIDPVWEGNPRNNHRQFVAKLDDIFSENPEIKMPEAKAFHSFFYYHFNKPADSDSDYWIPALVTPDLIYPYDGIKYESVQCINSGLYGLMCVAVKPESAVRKLVLSSVEAYTFSYSANDNKFTVSHKPLILPKYRF